MNNTTSLCNYSPPYKGGAGGGSLIIIIGAGAAGCFCAINVKRRLPEAEVVVLERGSKALAKVAITGGGRCNLTNSFANIRSPKEAYPRGDKFMKRALKVFSNDDVMEWFEREGVRLLTQEDECVFPVSQNAMEIVDTLLRLMHRLGVKLHLDTKVTSIAPSAEGRYSVRAEGMEWEASHVVVTTGGSPKSSGLDFLSPLGLNITMPVPSLFTFRVDDKALHSLMGTVVENATARLHGTKLQAQGPVLVTHWGLSGPAVLKLSSYAARILSEADYRAQVGINWFGDKNEQDVTAYLQQTASRNPQKQLSNVYPDIFCQRHWLYLLAKAELLPGKRWGELGPKQTTRLASLLTNDTYTVTGRGQFKDEFVTCGGVSLDNLNLSTLECKQHPNLFFAGEVTDVDAITGGFNLQAAWTMGYIVSQSIIA